MTKNKIAVVGGGQIGQVLALLLLQNGLGDVVILEVPELERMARGKALDLLEMAPHYGWDASIIGTSDYRELAGCEVVIVTAGRPRVAGMTREDLLRTNLEIIRQVASGVKQHAPRAFCIIVTNPLDAMVYAFYRLTGFGRSQVCGMAGTLDTARWRAFVALELGVSVADVAGTVLGGHGPDMVPLPRLTTVGGVPLEELASPEQIERLVARTREAGTEIVQLFGTGSAFFSPAASALVMAEAYLRDRRRVLPCAALCQGEYGVEGLFVGVPCLISGRGVERIIELRLTPQERVLFQQTVESVRRAVEQTGL